LLHFLSAVLNFSDKVLFFDGFLVPLGFLPNTIFFPPHRRYLFSDQPPSSFRVLFLFLSPWFLFYGSFNFARASFFFSPDFYFLSSRLFCRSAVIRCFFGNPFFSFVPFHRPRSQTKMFPTGFLLGSFILFEVFSWALSSLATDFSVVFLPAWRAFHFSFFFFPFQVRHIYGDLLLNVEVPPPLVHLPYFISSVLLTFVFFLFEQVFFFLCVRV